MNRRPAAVSFDLDGTLYSTRRAAWRVLLGMPGQLRFLAAYRDVRQLIRDTEFVDGEAFKKAELEMLAQRLGCGVATAQDKLERAHEHALPKALAKTGPFADARPLLERLIQLRIPIAVLSDLPVERKLHALGLDDLGWAIKMDAGDTGALKPHARSFSRVVEAMGVSIDALVHVGDRVDTDVCGAQRCGAQAVWLTRAEKLTAPRGVVVIRCLQDLWQEWGL
jgi:putative hydrolase of the HAD superfamily